MSFKDTFVMSTAEEDEGQSPPKKDNHDTGDDTRSDRFPGNPTTPAPPPPPKIDEKDD